MPQSDLLTTILNDYFAEKIIDRDARKEVEKFYEYATQWLRDKKPIGLGHSFGDGLSVRFADAKDIVMIAVNESNAFTPPAVNITGTNGGSVRHASITATDASLGITGNTDY